MKPYEKLFLQLSTEIKEPFSLQYLFDVNKELNLKKEQMRKARTGLLDAGLLIVCPFPLIGKYFHDYMIYQGDKSNCLLNITSVQCYTSKQFEDLKKELSQFNYLTK